MESPFSGVLRRELCLLTTMASISAGAQQVLAALPSAPTDAADLATDMGRPVWKSRDDLVVALSTETVSMRRFLSHHSVDQRRASMRTNDRH
jgi:hypothetical protein